MKKNVGNHESNIRMVAGALIVLFALFIVEAPVVKIVLATVAAILAGTAFLHFCPINTLLKRDSTDENLDTEGVLEKTEVENESGNSEEEHAEVEGEDSEKSSE